MQDFLGDSLKKLKRIRIRKHRLSALVLALSLVVTLNVFWTLRQPGLTLAGDASCGLTEHTHDEACIDCELEEHVHSIECYSDETADVETLLQMQEMFENYPYTGDLATDLVGIAKTQAAYRESTRNFEIGDDGVRRGYTRYGAWYGTPYRDWSAAFVSFCLNYAGADPELTPGNIGANAMAELWKKQDRFAPAGEYAPTPGDLVFFKDNTVAIVTEVQSSTFYMICGDVNDAVQTAALPLNDDSIAGWGMTEFREDTPITVLEDPETITDLKTYLDDVGGSISFIILDSDDNIIHPDENNNYTVDPNVGYQIQLRIDSPNGILPGIYQYQLPAGVIVENAEGTFTLKNQDVGTWDVTSSGLITLDFNENMENQSGISIPAKMGVQFSAQDDAIDFDGQITVTVNPPPVEEYPTILKKWGSQGYEGNTEGKTDPSKIYWSVEITGRQDSQIPGSILTDRVVSGEWIADHRYTESDIAAGIKFGATDPDGNWHSWVVHQGDPGLQWTENGWSYQIPETVTCQGCGELELGNEGWVYLINYSTTPEATGNVGELTYANQAKVDGQSFDGYVRFSHGSAQGVVLKTGSYQADASGGAFHWEVSATIPPYQAGVPANFWYLSDNMGLYDQYGNAIGLITNDADKATVMASYHGSTVPVPHLYDASDTDLFAWQVSWSATGNGIEYGRNIDLLCRCHCNEENCPWWTSGGCESRPWLPSGQRKNFCQCWTVTDPVTFTFTYETTDLSVIENYGGVGNSLSNYAELFYILAGNSQEIYSVGHDQAVVTVPGLFKKELTQDFNGYTAHYSITVNEAKLALTDGSPLHIHDEMTETLAYISGSLVITSEDATGNTAILQQDVDYTVTYDGTGDVTDGDGNKVHILEITILHGQPVKYTIDYDATLIIPTQPTAGVKYGNSATITLWGEAITDESQEKTYTEFSITGESYTVQLRKTCETTGEPLVGAAFGLYNAQGGQIAIGETNEDGLLPFRTNIVQGIIFREHVLYYLQELQAPPGYRLDDTKRWFCFCNNPADSCETCASVTAETGAVRIPHSQIGVLAVTNEILSYDLPATGGPGVYPLILVSVMCIVTPLVYGSIRRRKRERRGVD